MGNKLNIVKTYIDGVCTIEPNIYKDDRGIFLRVFCDNELNAMFKSNKLKQISHSISFTKGTIKGMHFQYSPDSEIKMVKCIQGKIWDVVVDIRHNSPTFLKIYSIELSQENKKMIYIPKGFAHGFQTLEDNTELMYFISNPYEPNNEGSLNVNDPLLNIKWPLSQTSISSKDDSVNFIDANFKGITV